jgi:hypothetical protein
MPLPEGKLVEAPVILPCRPALYEPDQLSRVVACGFNSTVDQNRRLLDADHFQSAPAQRIELGEAFLIGAHVLRGCGRIRLGDFDDWPLRVRACEELGPAHLLNSQQGLRFFGHWLRDDCSVYELLRGEDLLISARRPSWPDAATYETLFGQSWRETRFAHVAHLTLWRDLGFSPGKAARLRKLRSRLRDMLEPQGAGRVVYLRRGASGKDRRIVNEDSLIATLSARGVRILCPETGQTELISQMLDAEIMITVEGSQAAHGLYALHGTGGLVILQPPVRFYNPHHEWARLLDMPYSFVVGEAREGGFHVAPDEVLSMVDRVQAARS